RDAFEALGYRPLLDARSKAAGDIWFRFQSSNDDVVHLADLQFKPTAKAYAVRLAVFNPGAQRLVRNALPVVLKYLHPSFASKGAQYFDRPHWLLFDVGRALEWPLVAIPNPLARDTWPSQLQELVDRFLESIFWKIKSISDILALLFRNDTPFEWAVSGPVMRAAEIIALGKIAGSEEATLRNRILEFRPVIVRGMHGSTNCEGMIDEFLERIGR
ncbi:MAG: hypothetical protein ABI624_04490, partial [Casimicrobiaceae bacterium]